MREIGSVESIFRYPVKSMAGEQLQHTHVSNAGLVGDRLLAFRRSGVFSRWLTARQRPRLVLYRPTYANDPATSEILVLTPNNASGTLNSPDFARLLMQELDAQFEVRFGSSKHDVAPVSLISYQEIRSLEDRIGINLDPRRFRSNFNLNLPSEFGGHDLIGARLRIGSDVVLTVTGSVRRCKIINIEPDTASIDQRILATVVKMNRGYLGSYARVDREGDVHEGCSVHLL